MKTERTFTCAEIVTVAGALVIIAMLQAEAASEPDRDGFVAQSTILPANAVTGERNGH
jgi:hypothetical protein